MQGRRMSGSSSRRTRGSTPHLIASRAKLRTRTTSKLRTRTGHLRETCNFRKHPDFNHSGRWEGCRAYRELRGRFDKDREVKLSWKQRADGTRLTTGTSAAPDPPRQNDAPTPILQNRSNDAVDRDHRRRRDDRDRRDHGGRGGAGGRGHVHFEKDKGTPCLTSIITHLTCNCGGAGITAHIVNA